MSDTTYEAPPEEEGSPDELKRSITGRLLFFYTLGDVLGSGIYVLIGAVAAAVGGAFWMAFAVGVSIAALTGMAYAELATKYPRAAGAALYVNKAFKNRPLTFLITVMFLSASFAAAGALTGGFTSYFGEVFEDAPALVVGVVFILVLTVINFIGISESVVINMIMTFVEVAGLVIVLIIGIWYVATEDPDFGGLMEFSAEGSPILAIVTGVALSFFAMTGFENTANVAEETIDPSRNFPRALIGGMVTAGVIYVLVAMTSEITVGADSLAAASDAGDPALIEVVREGIIPLPVGAMVILFSVIAMIAITNTTLVCVVTQPRVLYGMARENVVPGIFAKIHETRRSPWVGLLFSAIVVITLFVVGSKVTAAGGVTLIDRLAAVTVVLLLGIYALVILACLKLRGQDETEETFRANTFLLFVGLAGNIMLLGYVIWDDPQSLIWCAALIAIGVVLFIVEYFFGRRGTPGGEHADAEIDSSHPGA